jgi:hypothetical protein
LQAQVLVVEQLGGGEAVVELDEVEILGADARALVGLLRGVPRERAHVGQRQVALAPRIGGENRREHLHLRPDLPRLLG